MKVLMVGRCTVCLLVALAGTSLLFGLSDQPKTAAAEYRLLQTVPLPDAPGGGEYFDYITVDPVVRRVYVSHGTEVLVLNADNYSIVGKIGDLSRCHGIALAKDLGKGFISDGDSKPGATVQEVVIFDLKTLKVTGKVPVGQLDVDAIVYEPVTKHVLTFNGDSHNATVIDPVKQKVIATIDLVGKVEFPVADGTGMVYDNNPEKNDVVAIDARTNTVKARWPTTPSGAPTAMAIDQKTRRLFSAGRGPKFVTMIDADNGKVLASYPISGGVDAVAFDPGTRLVFVSTKDGMLHIYHEDSPDKLTEVKAIKTEYGAKTCQVDPKTHRVFLTTSDFAMPPATEKDPKPAPKPKPGNFRMLVYGY